MTLTGIKMQVVGRDATHMRGRGPASTPATRPTPSPSAPARASTPSSPPRLQRGRISGPDVYVLYNRAYTRGDNLGSAPDGGGQRTEVHVYPAGALPAQAYPNQHPDDPA